MATANKPSLTQVRLSTDGIDAPKDFLSQAVTLEKASITKTLHTKIRAAIEFGTFPLDLSGCILIDGLSVTNFVTGENVSDAADIVRQLKIDAVTAAINACDDETIDRLYRALSAKGKVKASKPEATSASRKAKAADGESVEDKAKAGYTSDHLAIVAKNLKEALESGKKAPTTTYTKEFKNDELKKAGVFSITDGVETSKVTGGNPAVYKKIATLAFRELTGEDLPNYKAWQKWTDEQTAKKHAEWTAALEAKGF